MRPGPGHLNALPPAATIVAGDIARHDFSSPTGCRAISTSTATWTSQDFGVFQYCLTGPIGPARARVRGRRPGPRQQRRRQRPGQVQALHDRPGDPWLDQLRRIEPRGPYDDDSNAPATTATPRVPSSPRAHFKSSSSQSANSPPLLRVLRSPGFRPSVSSYFAHSVSARAANGRADRRQLIVSRPCRSARSCTDRRPRDPMRAVPALDDVELRARSISALSSRSSSASRRASDLGGRRLVQASRVIDRPRLVAVLLEMDSGRVREIVDVVQVTAVEAVDRRIEIARHGKVDKQELAARRRPSAAATVSASSTNPAELVDQTTRSAVTSSSPSRSSGSGSAPNRAASSLARSSVRLATNAMFA